MWDLVVGDLMDLANVPLVEDFVERPSNQSLRRYTPPLPSFFTYYDYQHEFLPISTRNRLTVRIQDCVGGWNRVEVTLSLFVGKRLHSAPPDIEFPAVP